ncbi:pentapeptide repeat-containing protein [Haloquadratum walsbyi]|uniref:Low-complexity protein n=1 Tax=Haloquadratum walsbyi J07HQW2 TaxID=1238425 RepID=U1PNR4_9EURY|nr:pentapeptide repeat-containing protein [Haloquadratum walsbyi]ERG93896.1 MAG: hypothetical protein J07HQW2_00330 [Haloquadratum walsbyi J07HQW2]
MECCHTFNFEDWQKTVPEADYEPNDEWSWSCSHPRADSSHPEVEAGSMPEGEYPENCLFHISSKKRDKLGVTDENVSEHFYQRIHSGEEGSKEFVDAHLTKLDLSKRILDPEGNQSVDLRFCTIEKDLYLRETRVENRLKMQGSKINRVRMEGAYFGETLDWYGCKFSGTIKADDTRFCDKFLLARSRLECTARFGKRSEFQGLNLTGAIFKSNFKLPGATVSGLMYSRGTKFKKAKFKHTVFEQEARFAGVCFNKKACFSEVRFGDDVSFGKDDPDDDRGPANFDCVANFSDSDFNGSVDFNGTKFAEKINFPGADLSDADLTNATLSNADLSEADLTDTDLRRANLTDANLSETDFSRVTLSRQTTIGDPREQIEDKTDEMGEEQYDQIARANHELRTAYSTNGLTGQARTARVRERKARRREALAEDGLRGTAAWFGSLLSQFFTGYGIQLRWILGVMIALFVISTFVYWMVGGMTPGDSLMYSIVTFTTSRPAEPELTDVGVRIVAGIETFAGTAAIVFLGYVLGTRERV